MTKRVGAVLIAASVLIALLLTFTALRLDYWLAPPNEKFVRSWQDDIALLQESKRFPQEWYEIKEVNIRSDNSPAQEWIENLKAPITLNPNGTYRLNVFVIHWLEDIRYGVVVQYNLVDLRNNNTVWELGRTFKLGFVY